MCCCVTLGLTRCACGAQTGLMRAASKGRAAFGLQEVGVALLVQGGHSRGMDRYAQKSAASDTELVGDVGRKAAVGA